MRWTKLKQLIEARFADSLQGRLEVHMTRYRKSHPYKRSELAETWFTFDGHKLFGWSDGEYYAKAYRQKLEYEAALNRIAASKAYEEIREIQYPVNDVLRDLFFSLSLSAEDMLKHKSDLIRSLALIDARFGKRRLQNIHADQLTETERCLLEIRLDADQCVNVDSLAPLPLAHVDAARVD